MVDQTQPEIAEVQSRNKAKNFDRENTNKLNQAKDIYKESNGLDNISEFDMNKFKEIMFKQNQPSATPSQSYGTITNNERKKLWIKQKE